MSERVPEGWNVKSLGDFLLSLPKSTLPSGVSDELGYYDFYVCSEKVLKSFHKENSSPAVLFSTGGEASIHLANGHYAYSTDVWATEFTGEVCNEYVFRVLEKNLEHINYAGFQGSGIKHLDKGFIQKFLFSFPALSEQKKIASILTSVDEVIENTQKKIDKLQDLKKATMNELLTKGIGHTEFKDSELGRIPKSWETFSVSDVCEEIFLGLTSKVDYVDSGGVYLVRATDISTGVLDFSETKQISKEQHQKLTKYRKAKKGDILVSKSGSLGICALVNTDTEFSIYESIIVMQSDKKKLSSNFLLWFLRSSLTQHQLLGDSVGSTVGHLNLGDFRQLTITLPPLDEQVEVAKKISAIDDYLNWKSTKLSQTQSLKKSLMQDLLTGKVRVQVN